MFVEGLHSGSRGGGMGWLPLAPPLLLSLSPADAKISDFFGVFSGHNKSLILGARKEQGSPHSAMHSAAPIPF